MKSCILFIVTCFVSCLTSDKDEVEPFIPGVYVTTINQEFSRGNDTLIIGVVDETGNVYQILRNSSYQRIMNGRVLPVETKSKKWIAIYDEDEKTLTENVNNATISFAVHANTIYVGSKAYRKISNAKQLIR